MSALGVKRIVLCVEGDSADVNLWSNIPCLLGNEVERRGVELIRVNLQAPWLLRRLWRYTLGFRHKIRNWQTSYDFYRSRTNHWLTTWKLNQVARLYGRPGTILINLSISSSPTISSIPVVLLSDWSYHHYITTRLGRQPDRSERGTISRDSAAMARASLVVSLFPESAARLQREIPAGRFRFLGHVINDHPLAPAPPADAPAANTHHPWRLLFIGRPRYREGLECLLVSLQWLAGDQPIQLDVIGIDASDLSDLQSSIHSVHLHGYLSKAKPSERQLYYQLLNQADLIVNASERWGGFSATVEAMHRRTAVLTPPYNEFTALFGESIAFGELLTELSPQPMASAITSVLVNPERLKAQQEEAHRAVAGFSWSAFVDRLLTEIEEASRNL
jgi:glycosyltransferase involved in cell wall biosynthesis